MTPVRLGAGRRIACAAAALAATLVGASTVEAASIKDIFEKRGLIGTFAWDCSKPASPDNNWYFVNRVVDADHVQRDYMTASSIRAWYSILDKAEETSTGDIRVSGTRDGRPTDGLWRVEQNRMLQVEATQDGKTIISGGKWVNSGKDMPWLNRCGK
jgi:hypothetical protein